MTINGVQRPFLDAYLLFPTVSNQPFEVRLLVDTGADGTRLSPRDARRMEQELGIDIWNLPQGDPDTGIGGQAPTRVIPAILLMDGFAALLALHILEPQPGPPTALPSLLGRDVLSSFALFMEERTSRVLLLEPHEADALALPH